MVTPQPFANSIDRLLAICLHAETLPLADARWARGRMPTATAAYRADLLFRPHLPVTGRWARVGFITMPGMSAYGLFKVTDGRTETWHRELGRHLLRMMH